jgi:hypothetical protein
MSLASRVLEGLGPAFRRRAGGLVPDLVEALTSQTETADQLVAPTENGWAAAFDARVTPDPVWLGNATGTKVPAGLTIEQQQTYLTAQPGWRRGTVPGMKAAVRTVLVGLTRRVDILERVDDSPYRFGIRVWASELPGGDTAPVIAAALTQKPLGLLTDIEVELVDHDATFGHFADTHTFGDVEARFPTVGDMHIHVPEEGTTF